jgi:hypothetical protein
MLNLLPRAQVPRKAGAKLQHFHETNKSFAKFYLIIRQNHTSKPTNAPSLTLFVINNKVLYAHASPYIASQASRSQTTSSSERWGERVSNTRW